MQHLFCGTVTHNNPDRTYLDFIGFNIDKYIIYKYSLDKDKITQWFDNYPDDLKYVLKWSSEGKWLSCLTWEEERVVPESTLLEADFDKVISKLDK